MIIKDNKLKLVEEDTIQFKLSVSNKKLWSISYTTQVAFYRQNEHYLGIFKDYMK